jgi:predicted membrane protein
MNHKKLFGIIMAVLIFGLIVLSIETTLTVWQVAAGLIIFWLLSLGFTNLRNSFLLLIMTLILLLIIYLSFKYSWLGVLPGAIVGITIGLLMHFGWIVPHEPFSRSDYIRNHETSGKK